jgi:hypothetical protein
VSNNLNLSLSLLTDGNNISKVVGAAINLDSIVQKLLKSRQIKNLVVDSSLGVDSKFLCDFLALLCGATLLYKLQYISLLLSRSAIAWMPTDSKAVYILLPEEP